LVAGILHRGRENWLIMVRGILHGFCLLLWVKLAQGVQQLTFRISMPSSPQLNIVREVCTAANNLRLHH
jgi:hypothetical protein